MTTNNEITIKLDQFLKWQNILPSGGEAKRLIQEGKVLVNGNLETRRGRKLVAGDVVTINATTYKVPKLKSSKKSDPSCQHCDGKGYVSVRDCSGEIQREETCSFCGGKGIR